MSSYIGQPNDFIIGDIHGCFDSFMDLLTLARVNVDKDRIISVGDIVDKGNKIRECLEFVERYGVLVIQGNHENKMFRWGRGNKVQVTSEMADTRRQLGDEFERYAAQVGTWPLYLPFTDDQGSGYIVHGGVSPHRSIEEQDPKFLMMLRTWPFVPYVKGEPLGAPPWQMAYTGHLGTILHGHIPSASIRHSGDILHDNPHVYSLDGGCVYGQREWGATDLRGIRLGSREVFWVHGRPDQTAHYNSL